MSARVIVCGSRRWHDRQAIADALYDLALEFGPAELVIVHGAARGADRIAGEEAGKAGLLVEEHPARWDLYGKRAGFVRNQAMADAGAALCLSFWDGASKGTADMVRRAGRAGIPRRLVLPQDVFASKP